MKSTAIKSLFLTLIIPISIIAQTKKEDPIILNIDNHKITKSEFLRIYNKNNPNSSTDLKALQDYMELFINYKLKVVEAEHLGFDTVSSFITEYNNYRDQLAKPYFNDTATEQRIIRDVYEKMKYELRVRQIFLKVNTYASASDTLVAYNKAMEIINRLKKGEPWDSLVTKYSQDPNSERNKGDFGYFTVFQTLYPFEVVAYNLKVGELSKPVRTKYGYHILELLDKRPSRGEIKAAHIMVAFPENAPTSTIDSVKLKITDIYNKLKSGESFEELAKQYSDDKRSAVKGGELKWFGVGNMIPEFENAAFALTKNGEFTTPIRSSFGWHIIKRLDSRSLPVFDDLKDNIKQKISRDERAQMGQDAMLEKIKKENNFKENKAKLKLLVSSLDTTIFENKWSSDKASNLSKEVLCSIGNNNHTIKDFADYLVKNNKFRKPIDLEVYVNFYYKDWIKSLVTAYENSRLEEKYPDFKFLVQEYHDGILLFNLMEQKIWNEAAKDTIGVAKYYNDHKDLYKWSERIEALVVTSPDKNKVDSAYLYANDFKEGKISPDAIWKKLCPDTTQACFNCQFTKFEKGDNSILDSLGWTPGITPIVFKDGKYGFFVKKGTIPGGPKSIEDAKGTCIADYQQYLETNYLSDLRKKYKIEVNQQVLESIKK